MSKFKIQHQQDGSIGSFTIADGGNEIGLMSYTMISSKVMSIYHTEVDESAEGNGMGTQLVKAGVEYARKHDLKIEPACSFAQSVFKKQKDFADVLV